ncbi:hypothetical protein AX761_23100 [Rhizobium sp. 58]|nr:hypothetical protein AX761_23100 [Rhizobium sp. 58]
MRIFRSIVETLVGSMLDSRHNRSLGRAIRAKLVGDDPLRRHALLLQQPDEQSLGGLRVASALNNLIENIARWRRSASL